jgi:hypothetical protein
MRRWTRPTLPLLALTPLAFGCPSGDDAPPADGTDTETGTTGSTGTPTDSSTTRPEDTTTTGVDSTTIGADSTTTGDTDTTTGEDPTAFRGPTKGGPIAISPDESRLAVVSSGTGELTIFALPGLEE